MTVNELDLRTVIVGLLLLHCLVIKTRIQENQLDASDNFSVSRIKHLAVCKHLFRQRLRKKDCESLIMECRELAKLVCDKVDARGKGCAHLVISAAMCMAICDDATMVEVVWLTDCDMPQWKKVCSWSSAMMPQWWKPRG